MSIELIQKKYNNLSKNFSKILGLLWSPFLSGPLEQKPPPPIDKSATIRNPKCINLQQTRSSPNLEGLGYVQKEHAQGPPRQIDNRENDCATCLRTAEWAQVAGELNARGTLRNAPILVQIESKLIGKFGCHHLRQKVDDDSWRWPRRRPLRKKWAGQWSGIRTRSADSRGQGAEALLPIRKVIQGEDVQLWPNPEPWVLGLGTRRWLEFCSGLLWWVEDGCWLKLVGKIRFGSVWSEI